MYLDIDKIKQILPYLNAIVSDNQDVNCDEELKIDDISLTFFFNNLEDYTIVDKTPTKPRTMKDLVVGDIIVNKGNDKREVLGITGRTIILSDRNAFNIAGSSYTLEELLTRKFKLYLSDVTPPEVEITIEEIAKLKGVPVDSIRIKD